MKKLLSSTLVFQLLFAGTPPPVAQAAGFGLSSVDDCKEKTKVSLSRPKTDKDKVNQECGNSQNCKQALNRMWALHESYSSGSADMCAQIFESGAAASGAGRDSFSSTGGVQSKAKDKLKELADKQKRDFQQLKTMRERLYQEASRDVPAEQRQAVTRAINEHKRISNISMEEAGRKADEISQRLQAPPKTKTALRAATQIAAFQTGLQSEANQNTKRVADLEKSVSTLNERADGSGSVSGDKDGKGFSLNDLAPWAGVAVAGLGALAGMQNKQSASGLDSAASQNPYGATATPSISDNPTTAIDPADVGESSTGNASGGGGAPSFSTDGNSKTPGASFQQDSPPLANISPPPAASTGEGSDGIPSQFNGALGGSPFSGSATSGPGGASGSGDFSSSSAGAQAEGAADGAGGKGKVSDDNVIQAGSIPGFAGGSSSGSSSSGATEPSLKDLFKTGDPFAAGGGMPDGTVAGAIEGAGLFDSDGNLAGGLDNGASASDQSGMIPGANDSRTLFVRVHDYHQRCQKKGCVTSEAGGKI